MSDESMTYDIVVVGAGPAGLSAAIRLKQLDPNIAVCILEKSAEVGGHILSGCVFEPKALDELIPDWKDKGAPLDIPVTKDQFAFMTESSQITLPTPPYMHNKGNYVISLGNLCKWLGQQATGMGIEIYPGFAARELVVSETGTIEGIQTGDAGLDKDGNPTPQHQPGMKILAKQTLFAEGCRGSLSEQLIANFNLRDGKSPQTYGIGFKEIWQLEAGKTKAGTVFHSIGWPLDTQTYGGSFIYHLDNDKIAVGFVVGLDYKNPHLSPFEEFQRFKLHPKIKYLFEGGKRLTYGARALNEGGWQSLPKLTFPGGALIGCAAGFLNVPKIKGTHTAMKSGMLAAEGVHQALQGNDNDYPKRLEESWVAEELKEVRNIRPGFQKGLWSGLMNAAKVAYLTKGKESHTFEHHADHESLDKATDAKPIDYPKPDGTITFDRLSSVYLCNTHHREDQPNHLLLKDPGKAISHNYTLYKSPETKYCPAHVYEVVDIESGNPRLQINSANCIHCKTCDIKDPLQNIQWVAPEGGSGPNFSGM